MQTQMTNWRAKHRDALNAVRAALKPGDPRRFALLTQIDNAAVALRAAESKKAQPK
jgi:hypothetical protein